MSNETTARKLTHLQLKKETGIIQPANYKQWVTRIGRRQKYPRELGLLANQLTRSALDIIQEYPKQAHIEINRYADITILSGSELHIVAIDFESTPATDEPGATVLMDDKLRTNALFAYYEAIKAYDIRTIGLSKIFAKSNRTHSIKLPIKLFIEGE